MNDAGYRTPSPVPSCSRCKAALDVARAVLSSEGLPLCPRCDAEAKIAAAAAPPHVPGALPPIVESAVRRIPWNDAKVSLGLGVALLAGAPLCAVGMWNDWMSLDGTLAIYGISMPVVIVTTVRALARASRARDVQRAAAPLAGYPDAWATPQVAGGPQGHPNAQRDAKIAAVGAGMAIGGCGAITVILLVAGVVAVAVVAFFGWWVLKAIGVIH